MIAINYNDIKTSVKTRQERPKQEEKSFLMWTTTASRPIESKSHYIISLHRTSDRSPKMKNQVISDRSI
jgi:hypothetical protein